MLSLLEVNPLSEFLLSFWLPSLLTPFRKSAVCQSDRVKKPSTKVNSDVLAWLRLKAVAWAWLTLAWAYQNFKPSPSCQTELGSGQLGLKPWLFSSVDIHLLNNVALMLV